MVDYDVRQTCRTCLSKADELLPLDRSAKINLNIDSVSFASKTNGDLLMELAKVQVSSCSTTNNRINFKETFIDFMLVQRVRWTAPQYMRRMCFGTEGCHCL